MIFIDEPSDSFILSFFDSINHTWASLQSWEGYPPPEFFLLRLPPFKRDYLEQNIPPLENFFEPIGLTILYYKASGCTYILNVHG